MTVDIQPIPNIPALKVGSSLVIADMHIGLESHLMSKGFHILSRTDDMLRTIRDVSLDCNNLIILGDVKHTVPGSSKQEYREIPDFFESLLEIFTTVNVVRGNHDTNIEDFLPARVKIKPASGMVLDDVGFIHGHTWPSEEVMGAETLVVAHNHPAVMFKDGIGKRTTEPCWVRGKFISGCNRYEHSPSSFIMVPAFNRMLGGSPVNIIDGKFLGPVLSSDMLNMGDAHVYLLDGIDLGKRSDIMLKDNIENRFGNRHESNDEL